MSENQLINSAALYFARKKGNPIPVQWLEAARELFAEFSLSPVLFSADGGRFRLDDCYVLDGRGKEVVGWGSMATAADDELLDDLQKGVIESLGLDSPRRGARDREEWRAKISAYSEPGKCYFGINVELLADAATLLRRAYEVAKGSFTIRYGIAYKAPLSKYPDSYSSGFAPSKYSDVREIIQYMRERDQRKKTQDELWRNELNGRQRYLSGHFRDAYQANILCESHLRATDLSSSGIGRLSELDEALWLWELSDSEIPVAQAMLASRRVLISQADEKF